MIRFLWQLPQHLIGMVLILLTQAHCTLEDRTVYLAYARWFHNQSICLGDIIIIGQGSWGPFTIRHEKMHQGQSHLLGPIYLFTIGVVSIIRTIYARLMKKSISWYYGSWPENWYVGEGSKDYDQTQGSRG